MAPPPRSSVLCAQCCVGKAAIELTALLDIFAKCAARVEQWMALVTSLVICLILSKPHGKDWSGLFTWLGQQKSKLQPGHTARLFQHPPDAAPRRPAWLEPWFDVPESMPRRGKGTSFEEALGNAVARQHALALAVAVQPSRSSRKRQAAAAAPQPLHSKQPRQALRAPGSAQVLMPAAPSGAAAWLPTTARGTDAQLKAAASKKAAALAALAAADEDLQTAKAELDALRDRVTEAEANFQAKGQAAALARTAADRAAEAERQVAEEVQQQELARKKQDLERQKQELDRQMQEVQRMQREVEQEEQELTRAAAPALIAKH